MADLDDFFAGKATFDEGKIVALQPGSFAGSKKPRPKFKRTNTNDLMAKEFEPIRWIVRDYLPEGFSVLAGRQKLGKTWLALDIGLAVASGGTAMGAIDVEQGDVLYLDLENGQRRIQGRVDALYPTAQNRPDLKRLEWVTDAPALDKGLLDALDDWRLSITKPRLVVIDVLQRIKPDGSASRNSYENDYVAWAPLQRWATEHGIAVLGLHHTKKGGADDPLEALSGSNGLSACADTTLVLDRDGNGITLYVRGRDVDEKESALTFSAGIWSLSGDAAKVRMTAERHKILDALADADEPMSPTDIADATRMRNDNVRQLLVSMGKAGEVVKVGRGRYVHPDHNNHKVTKTGPGAAQSDDVIDVMGVSEPEPICDQCGEPRPGKNLIEVRCGETTALVHQGWCETSWLSRKEDERRSDTDEDVDSLLR